LAGSAVAADSAAVAEEGAGDGKKNNTRRDGRRFVGGLWH
jgi:hypothetical protein